MGPRMEICETSGLPIPMVPHLHQSNGYIKRNLWEWRAQKCIALVCGKTPPTCAGLQTTQFHGLQYGAENGNMRNFGPTNPHGAAFAPKQWLYQKEATDMESSKMYCPRQCRNSSYQCGAQTTPFHWWQYRAENGNMRNFGPTNLHGTAFPQGECLYQTESMGMQNPKLYCSSP